MREAKGPWPTMPEDQIPEPDPITDGYVTWETWARGRMAQLNLVIEQDARRIGELNSQLLDTAKKLANAEVVIKGMEAIAARRKSVEAWEVGAKVRVIDGKVDGTIAAIRINRSGLYYDVVIWNRGRRSLMCLAASEIKLIDNDMLPINTSEG